MTISWDSAMLSALWIIRLSPGRVFTVSATPTMTSFGGDEINRMSELREHILFRQSATLGAEMERNASTISQGGVILFKKTLKPIAIPYSC
jgi:hypothetical protein